MEEIFIQEMLMLHGTSSSKESRKTSFSSLLLLALNFRIEKYGIEVV